MLPDRVSNPGPLTYESSALPIALRGAALFTQLSLSSYSCNSSKCIKFFMYYFIMIYVID